MNLRHTSLWLMAAITAVLAPGERPRPDAPQMQVPPPRRGVKKQNCGPYNTTREDERRARQRLRLPQHEIVRLLRLDAIREERATAHVERFLAAQQAA
jgi:hypothetical protein